MQCVVFDLDGVLFDSEKLVLQSDGDAFDQFLDAAERGESHA